MHLSALKFVKPLESGSPTSASHLPRYSNARVIAMKADTTTSPSLTAATDAVQPAQAQGREDLKAWEASQPDNIYLSDAHFKRMVPLYVSGEALEKLDADLERFGAEVVSAVDPLVRENNLHQNLPRLERYS